ncbi:MAG: hypothetical protein K9H41_05935 [Bacteroidia bacterium]|jgi:hypothetical protein|nr:hypothetical protein [Bacteroidia bacterium]
MEVYISKQFLENLDNKSRNVDQKNSDEEIISVLKIKKLLSLLKINTNFSKEEILSYLDLSGNYTSNSIKEMCLSLALKDGRCNLNDLKFDSIPNNKAFYFYDELLPDKSSNGIIYFKNVSGINDFYSKCMRTSRDLNEVDYSIIKTSAPDCNSMLYIDPYFFGDKDPVKRNKKTQKFIELLNYYLKSNLKVQFHLTILAPFGAYENQKKKVVPFDEIVFNEAKEKLEKVKNLLFEIKLCDSIRWQKGSVEQDRIFYTNYTSGNIGHPGTPKTLFNQNFIPRDEDVKNGYREFINNLVHWKRIVDGIPEKLNGRITHYCNKEFTNRLFENLENY